MSAAAPGLGDLCERFALPRQASGRFGVLLELIAADARAPTSVTTPQAVLDAHLADSLVALELEEVRAAATIADLGAGVGFPGLALAVALPGAQVFLVESARRHCAWLERARSAAGLANVEVVHTRVEEWLPDDRMDVVTARALAPLPVVVEYAAPLLRLGGTLVAWRGRRDHAGDAAAAAAAAQLGLEPLAPLAVRPFPQARDRHLHRFAKTAPTPERFPRRPGMATKRPLAASSEN